MLLWWHWLALPVVTLISWGAGRALRVLVRPFIGRLTAKTMNPWDDQLAECLGRPFTLAFVIAVFAIGSDYVQLTRPAYRFVQTLVKPGLAFAFFWALWRSAGVMVSFTLSRPWAVNSPSARSLLTVGASLLRGALLVIGGLAMIAALGYPISTVLAGVGIGGLALAFGAQKTVENVFGSLSLAADQPFRIGDLVRVEDFVGTVEDIGLRSTRFRTLDRTVISIPNGKLAEQRLESLAARDRMRLATTIGLTYDTTRRDGTVRGARPGPSHASPHLAAGIVVKFMEFAASSLNIEVAAARRVDWAASAPRAGAPRVHARRGRGGEFRLPDDHCAPGARSIGSPEDSSSARICRVPGERQVRRQTLPDTAPGQRRRLSVADRRGALLRSVGSYFSWSSFYGIMRMRDGEARARRLSADAQGAMCAGRLQHPVARPE